jgi:hypothetical protein
MNLLDEMELRKSGALIAIVGMDNPILKYSELFPIGIVCGLLGRQSSPPESRPEVLFFQFPVPLLRCLAARPFPLIPSPTHSTNKSIPSPAFLHHPCPTWRMSSQPKLARRVAITTSQRRQRVEDPGGLGPVIRVARCSLTCRLDPAPRLPPFPRTPCRTPPSSLRCRWAENMECTE